MAMDVTKVTLQSSNTRHTARQLNYCIPCAVQRLNYCIPHTQLHYMCKNHYSFMYVHEPYIYTPLQATAMFFYYKFLIHDTFLVYINASMTMLLLWPLHRCQKFKDIVRHYKLRRSTIYATFQVYNLYIFFRFTGDLVKATKANK